MQKDNGLIVCDQCLTPTPPIYHIEVWRKAGTVEGISAPFLEPGPHTIHEYCQDDYNLFKPDLEKTFGALTDMTVTPIK